MKATAVIEKGFDVLEETTCYWGSRMIIVRYEDIERMYKSADILRRVKAKCDAEFEQKHPKLYGPWLRRFSVFYTVHVNLGFAGNAWIPKDTVMSLSEEQIAMITPDRKLDLGGQHYYYVTEITDMNDFCPRLVMLQRL